MKLICELTETVDYELVEAEGKPKQYFIEGIFMQSERKNKNGRIYPLPVLEKEVIVMLRNMLNQNVLSEN